MQRFIVVALVLGLLSSAAIAGSSDSDAHDPRLDRALLLTRSPKFKLRAQAAMLLGTMAEQSDRIVGPLSRLLYDEHRAVRAAAAIALGKLGDVRGVGALSDALHDEDIRVARVAKRSVSKLVAAFVADRGRFDKRNYVFRIKHMGRDAQFKDLVMGALLEYENVDVGQAIPFEGGEGGSKAVELDLRGDFISMSATEVRLTVTLAFRNGGHVIAQFERVGATGKNRAEVMRNAASAAVGEVLGFLGAQ